MSQHTETDGSQSIYKTGRYRKSAPFVRPTFLPCVPNAVRSTTFAPSRQIAARERMSAHVTLQTKGRGNFSAAVRVPLVSVDLISSAT